MLQQVGADLGRHVVMFDGGVLPSDLVTVLLDIGARFHHGVHALLYVQSHGVSLGLGWMSNGTHGCVFPNTGIGHPGLG